MNNENALICAAYNDRIIEGVAVLEQVKITKLICIAWLKGGENMPLHLFLFSLHCVLICLYGTIDNRLKGILILDW